MTDAQVTAVVASYVEAHPDAIVPDGSISEAKLGQDVKDRFSSLSEEIANIGGGGGQAGQDGVGIQSVEQTTTSTEDGGTNIVTVTKTDGTTSTFEVRNGSKGPTGATPNIQIGTVETLNADSAATASMTGTPENPLLNLGIPKGADGAGGGGNISLPLLYDLTTTEEVRWIDTGDNAFTANNFLIVELLSVATATNTADASGSASMYPTADSILIYPWNNSAIANKVAALLPMKNDRVFRSFCFRGADGHWTSITSIRTSVNDASVTPGIITACKEGLSDQPMRGIIIGDASAASGTRVLGIGSRLRVWGC